MNKRQYKKLVKRNAFKIANLTEKEMYEIMKEFARGIKEGIESRMKKEEDNIWLKVRLKHAKEIGQLCCRIVHDRETTFGVKLISEDLW